MSDLTSANKYPTGYELKDLDNYLKRKTLKNKKLAEKYMDKIRKTN